MGENHTITLILESDIARYEVTGTFDIVVDANYGSDADGNRGEYREWIEEIIIKSIINEETGIDLLPRMEKNINKEPHWQRKTIEKIEEWFMNNVDISQARYDEAEHRGDEKYHELKEEGRI